MARGSCGRGSAAGKGGRCSSSRSSLGKYQAMSGYPTSSGGSANYAGIGTFRSYGKGIASRYRSPISQGRADDGHVYFYGRVPALTSEGLVARAVWEEPYRKRRRRY